MRHFTVLKPQDFGKMDSTDGQKPAALFIGRHIKTSRAAVQMIEKVALETAPHKRHKFYVFKLPMDLNGCPAHPLPVPTDIKSVPSVVVYDGGNPVKAFAGAQFNEPALQQYFCPSKPGAKERDSHKHPHDHNMSLA